MKKTLFIAGACSGDERAVLELMSRVCGPSWIVGIADGAALGKSAGKPLAADDLLVVFCGEFKAEDGAAALKGTCDEQSLAQKCPPWVFCSFGSILDEAALGSLAGLLGTPAIASFALGAGTDAFRASAIEAAAAIRGLRDSFRAAMPAEALERRIGEYLAGHTTCALATVSPDGSPRVTPIEYRWHEGCFWFFSEGGLKFAGLDRVSLCVYDEYGSMAKVKGLQVSGQAELVPSDSEDARRIFSLRGVDPEVLARLRLHLNVFRVHPRAFELLDASLKAEGFDSRQVLVKP
jgi:hypothetical protein